MREFPGTLYTLIENVYIDTHEVWKNPAISSLPLLKTPPPKRNAGGWDPE